MRVLLIIATLITYLYPDFKLSYLIDNKFKQTSYYKDKNHILFKISDNNKPIEDLLIINSKKYIKFKDNGIEHIYEISNSNSKKSKIQKSKNYTVTKKEKNITFLNYSAQKWTILDKNGKTEELIVTDNPKLLQKTLKTLNALKELLPNNQNNSLFIINKKYVILKAKNLQLLNESEQKLNSAMFDFHKTLKKEEQIKLSKEINKCFTNVCCGKNNTENSKELYKFLKQHIDNWKLTKSAKCKNITQKNLESAVYSNNKNHIIVELSTDKEYTEGKIDSLEKEGIKISKIQKTTIKGYAAKSAYLPIIDATILDITLPNTTISIYSKGKVNLLKFSKKALILYRKPSYSLID